MDIRTALREQSPSLALQRAAADEIAKQDKIIRDLQKQLDALIERMLYKEGEAHGHK